MSDSKWASRKLAGFCVSVLVLLGLAWAQAPGDAYTALGLIAAVYLGGQSAVDAIERR